MNLAPLRRSLSGGLRTISSLAPLIRATPPRNKLQRKHGISALVRVRDEPWIIPSLLSLRNYVDEIIVVDSSSDDTPAKIKQVSDTSGLNIHYEHRECDLREASQRAMDLSSYEWLLKWDGDFIAYTSGTWNVSRLREMVLKLSRSRYYMILYPLICLDSDLYHTDPRHLYHEETWLFNYHPTLRYMIHPKLSFEGIRFPVYYKRVWLKTPYAMHLRSVKSPERVLTRVYQTEWMKLHSSGEYSGSLRDFVLERVEHDRHTTDLAKASQVTMQDIASNLVTFDKERWGDYPEELKRYVKETMDLDL